MFNEAAENILSSHREQLNHAINLKSNIVSSFGPLYNLSKRELKILKKYIDKNLINEFIVRLKSSAKALILFVKKLDDSLRLCVNYRDLNAIFIKNKYSISLMNEILNRLKYVKRFIKLNLREVYNLIRIKVGDEWKTTFRIRYNSFNYRVMSFKLVNAFATF